MIDFQTSYTNLPEEFFRLVAPKPIANPKIHLWNDSLAKELGIELSEDEKVAYFSGNKIYPETSPLAMAYAGHQFGHFNMLGDGRALLLGELSTNGKTVDIQLKGSGRTPFSRRGDGKGTLSSMLREYLISEAMFALKIPTSRSLAVVGGSEKIVRRYVEESAVLTRTASSFIRVGTFEFAYNFLDDSKLQALFDYTINRHYPHLVETENPAISFLEAVMQRQIKLMINWIRVGFIHGVMNTDNVAISGETIDYGPCAFMNVYYPQTVYSSIDEKGRYSFGNQPFIDQWNMSCLTDTLLPLIHENEKIAIDMAERVLNSYPGLFEKQYWQMMANKIGFTQASPKIKQLVEELLKIMQINRLDYTNTFLHISGDCRNLINENQELLSWQEKWKKILQSENLSFDDAKQLMAQVNPLVIPRNHLVEKALNDVREKNDFTTFHELHKILEKPYERRKLSTEYLLPIDDNGYQTFCGT